MARRLRRRLRRERVRRLSLLRHRAGGDHPLGRRARRAERIRHRLLDLRGILPQQPAELRLFARLPPAARLPLEHPGRGAAHAGARPPVVPADHRRLSCDRRAALAPRPVGLGAPGDGGDPDADRHGDGGGRVPALRPRPGARVPRRALDRGVDDGRFRRANAPAPAVAGGAAADRRARSWRRDGRHPRRLPAARRALRLRLAEPLPAGVVAAGDHRAGGAARGHGARGSKRTGHSDTDRSGPSPADQCHHRRLRRGLDADRAVRLGLDLPHGAGERGAAGSTSRRSSSASSP